jgi:succinate dehydrogenase / fumarate reductase membrane anchor subunit
MANNTTSLRTTMSRIRHFGAARTGTEHAWAMRVTSAALFLLTIAGVWLALDLVGRPYGAVRDLFAHSVVPGVIAVLFVTTSLYHMKLGMQTIIEDYVHDEAAKTWSLIANTFFCALVAVATGIAILKLCVGA